ncbi:MAG: ABC transporter permease [Nocardioides sp.]
MSETPPETPTAAPETPPAPHTVRVVDAPLGSPSDHMGLVSVFQRRYLLRLLVRREVSARYSGSFLGLIWSYINPLSQFFIYWFVMGFLLNLHKDVPHFAVHVFSALIVVHFFIETFNAGTRSIVRNKGLVQKMAMPREMFPVASMLVSLWHVMPQVVILLVIDVLYGWRPDTVGMLAAVMALAIIMMLGTGLALMFSAANVFFRDFSSAVNILTNFVRFGVPMIYPFSIVPERFHGHTAAYLANPIADAVIMFQRAFWVTVPGGKEQITTHSSTGPAMPQHLFHHGAIAVVVSAVVLLIAQLVFSRLENRIPERL